jgi:hypothetical protein
VNRNKQNISTNFTKRTQSTSYTQKSPVKIIHKNNGVTLESSVISRFNELNSSK